MVKNHLSRLNAPKSWPIRRKGIKFIIRPQAGAHSLKNGISLSLVVRELLKYAKTNKEVKKILNEGKILVNNKPIKDQHQNLGIMDVISIPELKEHYILIKNEKGKFKLLKKDEKVTQGKLCKIVGKNILKKGKMQLLFFNGQTKLVEKDEYKTGDSLIVNFKTNKVDKHLKFAKGSNIYVTGGKKVGVVGKLEEINKIKEDIENIIINVKGKKIETSKKYALVIGDLEI
ncbi:30S ribosomal protein S4e [archaeon]|nr:30S ribosomal protein S4e [archaeon]|tara:strand:+ start:585 stop:1274 length:690 start_codon:yes stop_codon:yes gene_type:complete